MTVIVPDGLKPGDEFVVLSNNQEFAVTVPEGAAGNVTIELDLPSRSEPSNSERCVVTVPAGVGPGDTFHVSASWGGVFEIALPDGFHEGSELEVELPIAPPAGSPPKEQPFNIPLPPPPNASQGGVSWDQWDNDRNGAGGEHEHRMPFTGDASNYAPGAASGAAAGGGRYRIGDLVQVQRTSGMWSPALIKEYDVVSDTYTVELTGTLQLKYLITESELQPVDFQAEKCGEHFMGRRVMVPCVGAESKDDVMGEVRGYHDGCYTVLLDNGKTKRGLSSSELRVQKAKSGAGTLMD